MTVQILITNIKLSSNCTEQYQIKLNRFTFRFKEKNVMSIPIGHWDHKIQNNALYLLSNFNLNCHNFLPSKNMSFIGKNKRKEKKRKG